MEAYSTSVFPIVERDGFDPQQNRRCDKTWLVTTKSLEFPFMKIYWTFISRNETYLMVVETVYFILLLFR